MEERVEVAFRNAGPSDNLQHAGAGKALFTKQGKRRVEYALADGAGVLLGLTVGPG